MEYIIANEYLMDLHFINSAANLLKNVFAIYGVELDLFTKQLVFCIHISRNGYLIKYVLQTLPLSLRYNGERKVLSYFRQKLETK